MIQYLESHEWGEQGIRHAAGKIFTCGHFMGRFSSEHTLHENKLRGTISIRYDRRDGVAISCFAGDQIRSVLAFRYGVATETTFISPAAEGIWELNTELVIAYAILVRFDEDPYQFLEAAAFLDLEAISAFLAAFAPLGPRSPAAVA
ncbi:hypothetical protein C4552_04690 [Candidatus Parcubacteria bacterium]|nr:MAG: hypothetical protein C4552_04690 [Candidatus Parcubacteria bacterium]